MEDPDLAVALSYDRRPRRCAPRRRQGPRRARRADRRDRARPRRRGPARSGPRRAARHARDRLPDPGRGLRRGRRDPGAALPRQPRSCRTAAAMSRAARATARGAELDERWRRRSICSRRARRALAEDELPELGRLLPLLESLRGRARRALRRGRPARCRRELLALLDEAGRLAAELRDEQARPGRAAARQRRSSACRRRLSARRQL